MAAYLLTSGLLTGFVVAYQFDAMAQEPLSRRPTTGSGSQTAELLASCAQSDAKAFRKLYELHSARLYGIALRITRSPALASDAVHDAMLQVWRNASRYDAERGNADGWLISLVRYRALDIARKQDRETTGIEVAERVDESPDVLSRMMTDADSRALQTCLETVEPSRRRLVLLAFIQGMTQNDIAAFVGQPLGTVKSSIRRALLTLRACLTKSDPSATAELGS